jgi:hypothetical protein
MVASKSSPSKASRGFRLVNILDGYAPVTKSEGRAGTLIRMGRASLSPREERPVPDACPIGR